MSYVVVQINETDGGSVAIVHNTWLTPRKTEVYWPPYKSQNSFDKALLKGETVNPQWPLFKLKRIFRTFGMHLTISYYEQNTKKNWPKLLLIWKVKRKLTERERLLSL